MKKKNYSNDELEAKYLEFCRQFVQQQERKTRNKKITLGILISGILFLGWFALKLFVFGQLFHQQDTLTFREGKIYKKAAITKKNQVIVSQLNTRDTLYITPSREVVEILNDSLIKNKDRDYRNLVTTQSGITGLTKSLKKRNVPHFNLSQRIEENDSLSAGEILLHGKILRYYTNREYRHLRAYAFFILRDTHRIFFYINLSLIILLLLTMGYFIFSPLYGKFDSYGGRNYFKLWGIATGIGISLALVSSFTINDAAIFWTSGYKIFIPPFHENYSSYLIYLVWLLFISSLLFPLSYISELKNKSWHRFFVIPIIFILSLPLGFDVYALIKWGLSELFGLIWKSIGGWSSLFEVLIVAGIFIGLFSPSKGGGKTQEEQKAEFARQNAQAKRMRDIENENIAIAAWNRGNPNNQRPFKQ